MQSKNMNTKFDLVVRKVDQEFIVFHSGTGIYVKGKSLDQMYIEMETKILNFSTDMSLIGAGDLAEAALTGSKIETKSSAKLPWIVIFSLMIGFAVLMAMGLAIIVAKVENSFKEKELQIRQALENPTPQQTEARMLQLKKSLHAAEPYLIEIKKTWSKLPEK